MMDCWCIYFIYLGFYVTFNTVQVISRRVVGRAEETSTYCWSRFCTVNYRPMASNYQLSHLRSDWEPNPDLRGGRRECYHSATVSPTVGVVSKYRIPDDYHFDRQAARTKYTQFQTYFSVKNQSPTTCQSLNFHFKCYSFPAKCPKCAK